MRADCTFCSGNLDSFAQKNWNIYLESAILLL